MLLRNASEKMPSSDASRARAGRSQAHELTEAQAHAMMRSLGMLRRRLTNLRATLENHSAPPDSRDVDTNAFTSSVAAVGSRDNVADDKFVPRGTDLWGPVDRPFLASDPRRTNNSLFLARHPQRVRLVIHRRHRPL